LSALIQLVYHCARFVKRFYSRLSSFAHFHSLSSFHRLDHHTLTVNDVYRRFGTQPNYGLSSVEAARRLTSNGPNRLTPPKPKVWKQILEALFGGFCSILWFASIMCFLAWKPIGNPSDPMNLAMAILLLFVIALQAFFTAYQSWQTSRIMESINGMLATTAFVLRQGQVMEVSADSLVLGDLVQLKLGYNVPADLRLVTCTRDLTFDRSVLTGETHAVGASTTMTDQNYLETKVR
jgi:sodium/potassium-transporting ATPase subunit alpha